MLSPPSERHCSNDCSNWEAFRESRQRSLAYRPASDQGRRTSTNFSGRNADDWGSGVASSNLASPTLRQWLCAGWAARTVFRRRNSLRRHTSPGRFVTWRRGAKVAEALIPFWGRRGGLRRKVRRRERHLVRSRHSRSTFGSGVALAERLHTVSREDVYGVNDWVSGAELSQTTRGVPCLSARTR